MLPYIAPWILWEIRDIPMDISTAKEWLVEREHYHSGWAKKPQSSGRIIWV